MKISSLLRRQGARWLLLIMLLPASLALAATYTLPDVRPAGCTKNSNTGITCSSLRLGWGDSIVVTYANTTLTVTGTFTCGGNSINASSPADGFTISANRISSDGGSCSIGGNLIATNGDITTGSGDRITGSITSDKGAVTIAASNARVGGSISAKDKITLGHGTTVTGNVTSSNDEVVLNSSDVSVGGNVTAKKKVTLGHGSSVGGDVTSNIDEVLLLSSTARVSGNVTAQKKVTLEHGTQVSGNVTSTHEEVDIKSSDAQVRGCVTVEKNKEIKLGWHARVGGVCCRSGDSCSTACVDNDSGYAMPSSALCAASGGASTPIAEWRMDEATWTGTAGEAKDNSSNHFDGRAYNGANTTTSGKICNAGNFTGASNASNLYVDLGSPNLGLSATMTVSAWVNWQIPPGSGNAYSNVFTYNSASASDRGIFWLQHKSDNSQFEFALNTTSGRKYIWSTSGTVQNTWKHLVGVYDGSYLRLYVDGVASGSPVSHTGTIQSSAADPRLAIGHWAFVNSSRAFRGWVDEVKVYDQALTADQVRQLYDNENAGKNWDGNPRTCATTSSAPAALNAVDVGTNAVTGQITTKTAGTAFSLDIVALKEGAQDTAATGDVLVDLLANTGIGVALDANNCPTSSTALAVGTATLTAGKATVTVGAIADSWRDVRVRMRYPASGTATVTACSADNFAVKPAVLTAIASHGDWQTAGDTTLNNIAASGGVVHKAGQPFKLRVTGYNAANAITGNYNGSPTASSTCVLPASGCLAGTLSTGSFTAGAGTVASSTATYSEVGAISVTFTDTGYAAVDSDDTAASCAGFHACASAIHIGRFVPDHYEVASIQTPIFQTFASTCAGRSFTYVGQPFGFQTRPRARITAKNAAGGTTGNARGILWKLSPNGHFGSAWRCRKTGGASCGSVSISTPGFSAEQVSVNGDGSGDFTWPTDEDFSSGLSYQFRRTTPPPAPFNAEIGLGISINDSSESAGCGVLNCRISDNQASGSLTWGSHIAFDAGNEFRQGRLRLANAMGSERLPLPLRLTAQYWNGQGWATNTEDHCTPLTAPSLTFFSQTADNRLASGETTASFNATLVAGNGNLSFSAPGVGNFGYMNVSASAPDWLKYDWDGDNQLDDDPVARATFGKRKGRDKIIIRREMY